MDDTFIHVYPGSFNNQVERSGRRTIRLNAGHLLLFRGDLAHNGVGFDRFNVRLHCFVLVRGIPQLPDSTEAVVMRSFQCNRCTELFTRELN
ncbi:hypothetical protein V7S43_013681 [Phytophthora oleae]|uniref:Aspartyl/asparaginy/proline hydroxylase domain-containing protein n=1 Tax=Phytophthora oleae TaxID=2107226 RepID=A0ABD3F408_9STRA